MYGQAIEGKAEFRRWVRALEPPTDTQAAEVRSHLRAFLDGIDGVVASYSVLRGEVDIEGLGSAFPHLEKGDLMEFRDADGNVVPPDSIATILVPGRAFDHHGIRLGRGGGHYDRFLAGVDVPRVGVTTDQRIVDGLPREPHDVPMTHLATESGVWEVRYGRPT